MTLRDDGDRREGEGGGADGTDAPRGEVVMIDSHIHLDDLGIGPADLPAGWAGLIPGVLPSRTREVLAQWGADDRVRVAAAIHPWRLAAEDPALAEDPRWRDVQELVRTGRVDAIGETGFDRRRFAGDARGHARAVEVFVAHLALAREASLPVVVHAVSGPGLLLELLRAHGAGLRGVVHAFTGSSEVARELASLGFCVGVGGQVTRPDARRLHRAVAEAAPGTWLLETDAPWIGVDGAGRGSGRLSDLERVAEDVARLRGSSVRDILIENEATFRRMFPQSRDPNDHSPSAGGSASPG